jgi:hypothetical protein
MKLKTEFKFVLPEPMDKGEEKPRGVMRLIKVKDLVDLNSDIRVIENPSYFYVVLLGRVITSLGHHKMLNAKIIENLSTKNFAFLLDFLNQINHSVIKQFPIKCGHCETVYQGELHLAGEL